MVQDHGTVILNKDKQKCQKCLKGAFSYMGVNK